MAWVTSENLVQVFSGLSKIPTSKQVFSQGQTSADIVAVDSNCLIEMLNPFDAPGFLIDSPRAAFEVQDRVGSANLKIQYDIYHADYADTQLHLSDIICMLLAGFVALLIARLYL